MRFLLRNIKVLALLAAAWGSGRAAVAQAPNTDSLEAALRRQTTADTGRVKTLNELVAAYRNSKPERAMQLGAEALRLGQQLNFRRGVLKANVLLGITYSYAGRFPEARQYFGAGLRQSRVIGDSMRVAGLLNNIAATYVEQGRYEEAVQLFVLALRKEEQYGTPESVAEDLGNLGGVLTYLGRYDQALTYFHQNLKILSHSDRKGDHAINEANTLINLATVHHELQHPDSARYYADASLQMSQQQHYEHGVAAALKVLGQVAFAAGQNELARQHLEQAVALSRRLDAQSDVGENLAMLGNVYLRLRRYPAAASSLQEALKLAQQAEDLETQRDIHNSLTDLYAQTNRHPQALAELRLATVLQDSLRSATATRQVTEMQTKYDTERKEARNRLLAAQTRTQQQIIRRRNQQLVGSLVIAALLLGLGYLLYTRRRLRQQVELEQQRQRLERLRSQAVLEAEEAERRRIGSDLHDGVGQLLTAAKLNLHALGEQLNMQTTGQQTMLQNALDVVDESFKEVRSISHNLMPNSLIKRGLAQAVRDFLSKISPDGRIKVQLEVVGLDRGGRLDATVENVLFRVIQELVQNIVKHAQASQVTLQLIRSEAELTVMVEDNGVGFDPAALGPEAGIGLKNIESRMAYLGGRAEFDSQPGRGTTVTLEVPLTAATAVA